MDSTKSLVFSAMALAIICSAAPIAAPGSDSCSFDITIRYTSNAMLPASDLPSAFSTVFSALSSLKGVSIVDVPRHAHQLRDIRMDHSHSADEHHDEDVDLRVFGAFLTLTAPAACDSLPLSALLDTAALSKALPSVTILGVHGMPSVAAAAAEPLTLVGTANVLIADYADGSSDKWAEVSTESGEVYVVGGPNSLDAVELAEWSAMRSGDAVELVVEGVAVGPASAKSIGTGLGEALEHAKPRHRLLAITSRTPAKAVEDKTTPLGQISLLFIRIQFTDFNPDTLCNTTCIENNLWGGQYNVDGAYRDSSFGAISVPQSLGNVVTVTLNVASTSFACTDLAGVSAAAETALASQIPSVALASYKTRVYFTPSICAIGIAYLGSTPGKAFINSKYPDTIAHEVGHTFNMQHANRDPGDDNTVDEYYGDRSCIMGYSQVSLRGFNVAHRIDSGWIPSSAVMDLASTCSTTPTAIKLSAVSQAMVPGATVALRAVRRNLGRYIISFRNGDGYDGLQTSTYLNQVHLHYQIGTGAQTQLIAILNVGQSWSQANGDLTITVTDIESEYAMVDVTYCRPTSFPAVTGTLTCGSSFSGSNVGAPNLVGYTSGDVIFQANFQPGYTYTISTCGSTLDTVLRYYTDGLESQISYCDNCGGCSTNPYSAVLSGLSGNGNVFFSLEGFNVASGNYVISMTCTATAASPSPAASPAASPSPSVSRSVPTPSSTPSRSVSSTPSRSASRSPSHSPSPSKAAAAASSASMGM